jgi:hypothetical protein
MFFETPQAIWAHEPDDQRYLRLRNVPVPAFRKRPRRFEVSSVPASELYDRAVLDREAEQRRFYYEATVAPDIEPPKAEEVIKTRPLSEVADLDRPLGFKGNYMIFPLIQSNPITSFMMDPYLTVAGADYGLTDPDLAGNMTLDEFSDYVCCLREQLEAQPGGSGSDDVGQPNPVKFDDLRPVLEATLKRLLQSPLRDNEEIIVPTDSLYIEALPGAHPLLEDFKLLHRAIDVKMVQAQVREQELENVRRAERILQGELEDPEIEAKYVFEGDGTATIVPPGGSGSGR